MSRPFEVRRELDLPASPEDVWTALTTDVDAWQFPSDLDVPADGSRPDADYVKDWVPPRLFTIRMESPDGTFNALEYDVASLDGGRAHLRYVHSGILADGWEDQYDAIGVHTDFYLHTLSQYLQHFLGRPVTYVGQPSSGITAVAAAAHAPDATSTLLKALGLVDPAVGDPVTARIGGRDVEGVVDYTTEHFLGIRTADALYRFFGRQAFGSAMGLSVHSFVPVDAAAEEAALQQWLEETYS